MKGRPVRWGVVGATSQIYRQALRPALLDSPAAEVVATASRSGPDHDSDAPRRYGDYGQLLADDEVEAVYIPLPNDLHEQWTVAAAEAGKHVLCEKPLAPDPDGVRRMAAACAEAGVVLAEAYMTPFHPRSVRWDELIAGGAAGTLLHGTARFSFPNSDPGDYRWRADAGGGALLDVGIYCLEPLLAAGGWRPGRPLPQVAAHAVMSDTGVDATFSGWLSFPSGFTAAFLCSFDAPEAQRLEIVGTDAALVADPGFTPGWDDTRIHVQRRDGAIDTERTQPGAMYRLMVDHVGAVIRGTETLRRPPEAAIALAEVTALLRRAAGLPR